MKSWLSWDWGVFASTFVMIFLAELGDKTQLAAMTQAAKTARPLTVLVAASLALAVVTLIGVVVGGALGKLMPEALIKKLAAVVFVAFGALMWFDKF